MFLRCLHFTVIFTFNTLEPPKPLLPATLHSEGTTRHPTTPDRVRGPSPASGALLLVPLRDVPGIRTPQRVRLPRSQVTLSTYEPKTHKPTGWKVGASEKCTSNS